MKKTIALIVMLLIALITLTGCVNINYEVKVNEDGSADISYVYGISKETLESMQVSADEMIESMKEQAEESSYTVEGYEDDETAGFKASKHLENVNTDFSLQEAFGEEYVKDSENNGIKTEKNLLTTKYSQNAEIDLTSMEDMAQAITMTYTIKLPKKATTSNASAVSSDGKELTWNLTAGEVNKVEFVAQGLNVLALVVIVVAVALVVVVVGIIIFSIFKKKHVTKE